jgi:hypothetical protein
MRPALPFSLDAEPLNSESPTWFARRVDLLGLPFIAIGHLDEAEAQRRNAAGGPNLVRFSQLARVWHTPFGLPLLDAERDSLPMNTWMEVDGTAMRVARPPLHVEALLAISDAPARAVRSFGDRWWAPMRIAVVSTTPRRVTLDRASRLGVGVAVEGNLIVSPRRSRRARPSPALAWQAELIFDQITGSLRTTA